MDLVKDDLIGVADAPESRDEGQDGDDGTGNLVVPLVTGADRLLAALCVSVELVVVRAR
jgi:hypothetical protein